MAVGPKVLKTSAQVTFTQATDLGALRLLRMVTAVIVECPASGSHPLAPP